MLCSSNHCPAGGHMSLDITCFMGDFWAHSLCQLIFTSVIIALSIARCSIVFVHSFNDFDWSVYLATVLHGSLLRPVCGINHPPYRSSSHHRWVSLLTLVPKSSLGLSGGDGGMLYCGLEREGEREWESTSAAPPASSLLCAALRPGRSFLPHFLPTAGSLRSRMLACLLLSHTAPDPNTS